MKVRIQAFIDAPDRSYAYYPGQVIHDHEHAADWVARGQAVELPPDRAEEIAGTPEEETADQAPGETSQPGETETAVKPRRKRKA